MPQVRRRKCRHCGELYQPNFRNPKHQKYCSAPLAGGPARLPARPNGEPRPRAGITFAARRTPNGSRPGRRPIRLLEEPAEKSRAYKITAHSTSRCGQKDKLALDVRTLQDRCQTQSDVITGLVSQLAGSAYKSLSRPPSIDWYSWASRYEVPFTGVPAMAVFKRVLCRERLRRVPEQFSWLDHRLVRDRRLGHCSVEALALYLFLVVVCDGEGLSYYSDRTITELLPLEAAAVARTASGSWPPGSSPTKSPCTRCWPWTRPARRLAPCRSSVRFSNLWGLSRDRVRTVLPNQGLPPEPPLDGTPDRPGTAPG